MAINNALNVAGSIGGLAASAANLAGLANLSSSSLRQASFGGVPFAVESVGTSAGRKTTIHDYPFRDDAWVEDLGKKSRRFEVSGFLVEDDLILRSPLNGRPAGSVIDQRNDLLAVCEDPGATVLIHPTLGTIKNVVCLGFEMIERVANRVIEIRLTLMVTGDRLYPTVVISTDADSEDKADDTNAASLADFVKSTAASVQQGAAVVQQAVSTAVSWYQIGITAINDVKRVVGAVSTLAGNFGRLFGGANNGYAGANPQASPSVTADDLLAEATAARAAAISAGGNLGQAATNPVAASILAGAAQSLLQAVAATSSDPADAVRLVSAMAQFTPPSVTTPGQIGEAMSAMQLALSAMFRRCALAQLAVTLTSYQALSQQDASTVMGQAVSLIDNEIEVAGDAGDDQSYQALRALRQAVVADLTARSADLASISTFSFGASLPSLVLAQRIYRDPSREPQLVQQVSPRHPAFMPISFKALGE